MRFERLWNAVAKRLNSLGCTHPNNKRVNAAWAFMLCWMADCYFIEKNGKSMLDRPFHDIGEGNPYNKEFWHNTLNRLNDVKTIRCKGGNVALFEAEQRAIDFACDWFADMDWYSIRDNKAFSTIPYYDLWVHFRDEGKTVVDDKMIAKAISLVGRSQ